MKLPDMQPFVRWLAEAKGKYTPDEVARFLVENREKLEEFVSHIDGDKILYRTSNRVLAFFARLAGVADRASERVQHHLLAIPGFRRLIERFRGWKNHLNFKSNE